MDVGSRIRAWIARALDQRRSVRRSVPLQAYYWYGGLTRPHEIREISATGAYVITDAKWYAGTIINMTLQPRRDYSSNGHGPDDTRVIAGRVIRLEPEGMAVEFLHEDEAHRRDFEAFLAGVHSAADNEGSSASSESGQSLLEFALILPLLLLLIINVINFGSLYYAYITVGDAARAGAEYYITGVATLGNPNTPTAAQVRTIVQNAAASLPNAGSLSTAICTNNGGTVTCDPAGATSPPADPEGGAYLLGSVDVSYTYQPVVSLWNFPGLGIYMTTPSTTVRKRAFMRMMQ